MWISLGKVTVTNSGTPVCISATSLMCQTILVQQMHGNTGKIYVMQSGGNKTTYSGVLAVIPAPTYSGGVASVLPYAQVTIPMAEGALNPSLYWIDADNDNESALVSYVQL